MSSPLDVLFYDESIIVLNKLPGVTCHPVGHYQTDTLLCQLQSHFGPDTRLVHRLDRLTSGIMIAARTQEVARLMYQQFSKRELVKNYLVLVEGEIKQQQGTIDLAMCLDKSAESLIKIKMKIDSNGLAATTDYRVLCHCRDYSLVFITPHTGRKHQIRLHMAHQGHPVVGDPLYRYSGLPFLWEYYLSIPSPWPSPIQGLGLHACRIKFTHPITRQKLDFSALPPRDYQDFVNSEMNYVITKKDVVM